MIGYLASESEFVRLGIPCDQNSFPNTSKTLLSNIKDLLLKSVFFTIHPNYITLLTK